MKNSNKRSLVGDQGVLYDPLNDFLFYKIFGEKGDEVQLLGFINAVLGKTGDDKFTSVEILENKTFTPEVIGDKTVTFDVRAVLHGKTKVNVEVQLRNKRNMNKRSLFYWSREFSKSLKKGQDFDRLPNVISINIVNFDYLGTKDYHSCFRLRDDKEHDIILTEALEIHFINMVRYRKVRGKNKSGFAHKLDLKNPLCRWLAWLDKSSPLELRTEVLKMDLSILSAEEKLAFLAGDEDTIHLYDRRFIALCDQTSERNYIIEESHKKIIHNALAKGYSVEEINDLTGLNIETINSLK
jgi:predicted transposase/invertase (TIGR01784 family)